ncbi:G-protein beta WD-40 repeat-containing protein [Cynara cardunculus var. scolymus]|uniref:Katanin p80 WD40 repeat-containing subunit B1 homolog n=1 Tax=Cynara cardunculus var. scolymus TaxID=59895 RepID=A0A103XUC0_CYNCS|nr:G-protein beta WD-40 repeat-containing protein [Cynara cardunculus var. scolymus]
MEKRGYKLQEFVAHSANVNCIKIGKKTRRHFITGGDDEIVNLWSIGKSTCITSLSGHTSPIESVAFDSTEVLVAAGASSGVVKIWDLEETKVIRTLNGHRSYCTAVEFHPFGEFFASGSMDTNLKIWDIRKKGCIHTYKGHKRAISTIRFTPDGRWVVSGGLDNVVKIWDLTAGKLLHEFKFHEGHIRSMDFHPLEFLLATDLDTKIVLTQILIPGSSDRTVKFWDLETFELIGSTRPEVSLASGVRSITFHPDARTLFCGLDSSLKVLIFFINFCGLLSKNIKSHLCTPFEFKVCSWEPVICHDAVDIGWSTLGDLCIDDGKLLGCSYHQNSIGIWAADVSHIEPYGPSMSAKENTRVEPKFDLQESLVERVETPRRSFISPDDDSKDIKNIYVDMAVVNGRTRSLVEKFEKREMLNTDECQTSDLAAQILANTDNVSTITVEKSINVVSCAISEARTSPMPVRVPDMVPCAQSVAKISQIPSRMPDLVPCQISEARASPMTLKKFDVVSSAVTEAKTSQMLVKTPDSCPGIKSEEANLSPVLVVQSPKTSPNMLPLKAKASLMQRSVASRRVIPEKVRSSPMLVVRRSRASSHMIPERTKTSPMSVVPRHDISTHMTPEKVKFSPLLEDDPETTGRGMASKNDDDVAEDLMVDHDLFLSTLRSRLTKLQVVQHFWKQNNVRGAVSALQKLPDHAVQADVISVMLENIESLTLDLFSCLLPMLLGLFDSETERHINVSLEMLLKLVAVFGPVVSSTISAPPAVGVDLHAEKRLECCKQCHLQLQKIHHSLPNVIRRGGLPARRAQELNLVLQQS